MNTLDWVRNWTNQDGSIRTTYYVKRAILKKGEINPQTGKLMDHEETEDEFIQRVDETLRESQPEYKRMESSLDRLSDLPDMKDRDKFRRDKDGKVFVDYLVKTENEERNEKVAKLRTKLETLGLTQEEISLLVK